MRIFLDVGAHTGQTLEEAVRHGFDRIYAFEPMPREFAELSGRFGEVPGVVLCNFGLSDMTTTFFLYGTNDDMEASLYPQKVDVNAAIARPCRFVAATEFLDAHVTARDWVVMKLNCEGGEIPILTDLLDTGAIAFVDHLMVDFDCRKIPGLEGQEAIVTERLREADVNFALTEEVLLGETHAERIAHWLAGIGCEVQAA